MVSLGMNEKAYLVLSAKEISRLLKVARRSAKVNKAIGTSSKTSLHCIVLNFGLESSEYSGSNGERQLSNIVATINELEKSVEATEAVAPALKASYASRRELIAASE
jgi:hypothetical protein